MAILFSHVTLKSEYGIGEFFVCGFPAKADDLEGNNVYEEYLMGITDDAVIDVHVRSYLYGYGRTVTATPEELDYMKRRLFADPLFLWDRCKNKVDRYFEIHCVPREPVSDYFLLEVCHGV